MYPLWFIFQNKNEGAVDPQFHLAHIFWRSLSRQRVFDCGFPAVVMHTRIYQGENRSPKEGTIKARKNDGQYSTYKGIAKMI